MPIPLIPIIVGLVATEVAGWLLARRLRLAFPSLWDELGQPPGHWGIATFAENWNSLKPNVRLFVFAWGPRHRKLHDARVTAFVWAFRPCLLSVIIGAVLPFFVSR